MKNFSPPNTVSYQEVFKVKESEIDALNHVNNVVYLQWVNNIAEKHWDVLSNDTINQKYFWVAIRHEIDYLKPAFLGDEIRIETWIGETKGVKSIRNVHIYKEDQILVKTKSVWCLIDANTHRPSRITQEILNVLINKK